MSHSRHVIDRFNRLHCISTDNQMQHNCEQSKMQNKNRKKLEIRSVERGSCPIAKSTMNELFLQLWPDALRMHETAEFPLPVKNLTSTSCSSIPIRGRDVAKLTSNELLFTVGGGSYVCANFGETRSKMRP